MWEWYFLLFRVLLTSIGTKLKYCQHCNRRDIFKRSNWNTRKCSCASHIAWNIFWVVLTTFYHLKYCQFEILLIMLRCGLHYFLNIKYLSCAFALWRNAHSLWILFHYFDFTNIFTLLNNNALLMWWIMHC